MNLIEIKIIFFLIAIHFASCNQKVDSLDNINQDFIYSSNDSTKFAVAVDIYFENLTIPDSIKFFVDSLVQANIKGLHLDDSFLAKNFQDQNPYELEYDLKMVIRATLRAQVQADSIIIKKYLRIATEWASTISKKLSNAYWQEFLSKVKYFDSTQANAWLRAEVAHDLCRKYHDKLYSGRLAEYYGSYGLQCLKRVEDKRLSLDIKQRLQVFLFYYYPYHKLSVIWAEFNYKQAKKIGYYLRANGFNYHRAEALHNIGENEKAIKVFKKVRETTRKYDHIPYMYWFDVNSQIYMISCFIENVQIVEAMKGCNILENKKLGAVQEIQLNIMYGLIYRITGQYEKSEDYYSKAQKLIEVEGDYYNQIVIYNNLGYLYFQLTEYRKSLQFLKKGRDIIEQFQKHNQEYKSRILLAEAGVYNALGLSDSANYKLSQANNAINSLGNFPVLQSELFLRSAEIYKGLKNYTQALEIYENTENLCQTYGLDKYYLEMMTSKISTLIELGKYELALEEANILLTEARESNNQEKIIEAYAGLAEISFRKNEVERAVEISDKMLIEIENLSADYYQTLRLTSFRQKIYKYLKRSVLYEIHNQRPEEAFIKLGYAKARSLLLTEIHEKIENPNHRNFLNRDKILLIKAKLESNDLLLDYFMTDDTLYIFALNNMGLNLYKEEILKTELESEVQKYLEIINSTISVYKIYNNERTNTHYVATIIQSQKLFDILLGHEDLMSALTKSENLYLIKDEFLHQVPFSTLVSINEDNETFLVEKAAITNIPSNQFLFASVRDQKKKKDYHTLLLGADFGFSGVEGLVPMILDKYSDCTLLGERGKLDKSKILSELSNNYDKFIFIGHGKSNDEYPELSELLFMPVDDRSPNSSISITLGDFLSLGKLNMKMGILLGCETGHGKLYRGSGMMGIQQGLLSLGIKKVIGTYWSIEVAQSMKCASFLFQDSDDWSDPAVCLRNAQLMMIHQLKEDPYFKNPHPYFWGGFNYNTLEL